MQIIAKMAIKHNARTQESAYDFDNGKAIQPMMPGLDIFFPISLVIIYEISSE